MLEDPATIHLQLLLRVVGVVLILQTLRVELFAHHQPDFPDKELRTREMCTTTGMMLAEGKSQDLKTGHENKIPQNSIQFPFSDHDNRHALKNSICVFSRDVGRRKYPQERSEHTSHFDFCSDGSDTGRHLTAYQADYKVKTGVEAPAGFRRFPHNHKQKSEAAALACSGEQFMWFGRHDCSHMENLYASAATANAAPPNP
ncbi:testis-expressed protein 36 [Thalassophryne amazonica]|uniref:testis-expressed protein 36 n=1 Tax=Thalassophryne amazonica TaxID=390379 RepID=UPI0014715C71|nr:testis-expressed protein 36 [Thalassophryne amazonica]